MTGQQDERDPHQPVVQHDCARETESRVALAVPEQDAGQREEHGERSRHGSVELLARVEATLLRRIAAQPETVVEVVKRAAQTLSVTEEHYREQRKRPGNRGVEMDVLHERSVSDPCERGQV